MIGFSSNYRGSISVILDAITVGAIIWIAKKLSDRVDNDLEKSHRDALHSAIATGVSYAKSQAAEGSIPPLPAQMKSVITNFVSKTAPEALAHFSLGQTNAFASSTLPNMVDAKLFDSGGFASSPMDFSKALALVIAIIKGRFPTAVVTKDDELSLYQIQSAQEYDALSNEIEAVPHAYIQKNSAYYRCKSISDVSKLILSI